VFRKLKEALSKAVEKISTKAISEKELDKVLMDLELELIESDVALNVAEELVKSIKQSVIGVRIPRRMSTKEFIINELKNKILEILSVNEYRDIFSEARNTKPYVVMFMGVNGVGKTTTIAKVANKAKKQGLRPLLVAADTFRAGALEQLKIHGDRLGVPTIQRAYGVDPASVVYDAIMHAKARGYDMVLVDTAGRMHVDIDLMEELKKIVRVGKPHLKILVVDALTGNDAVEQARLFNEHVGVDGVIVTKVDADVKGGTILSVVYEIKKPILYLGIGQGYDDLIEFDPKWFIEKLF